MYVVWLENAAEEEYGEKARLLSVLTRERMPVPEGFVITREGFEFFLKKNNLRERIENLIENLDVDDYKKLREVSREIRNMFIASHIPDTLKKEIVEGYEGFLIRKEAKSIGGPALDFIRAGRDNIYVAVRVSGFSRNSSLPGLFDTFLGVSGQRGVLDSVKLAWASLYSPRAIFYRRKRGIEGDGLGCLIIQRMVDPEKSGVAMSVGGSVMIEGSWGFGNSLSYGLVSPDRYVLDSYSGEIRERKIGKKVWMYRRDGMTGKIAKECVMREKINGEILDEKETGKIFEVYKRVSECCGGEQVMEWAIERGRIYVLQARSLPRKNMTENIPDEEGERIEGYGVSGGSGKGPVRIIMNTDDFGKIGNGDIIATKILSPELVPFLGKATGVISEYGGLGSSVSLMCREMGIPCVTEIDISRFSDNQIISVSGEKGSVYCLSSEIGETDTSINIGRFEGVTATEVKLMIDLSNPSGYLKDADGIGLLTSEGVFREQDPVYMARSNPENVLSVLLGMESVAREAYPKTVWYRSYSRGVNEVSPLLGARGVRRSLEEPEMLKCEIEALKRLYSKGLNNVGIILPFVSSLSEFRTVKQLIPFSLKLGIEVSVPSAALEIESFCKEGLNLVSVNLPELAQLTLGVDRGDSRVSHLYSETNPAVMKLIEGIVRACRKYNIETSVSIERYDPDVVEKLVRAGVTSISVSPDYLNEAKSLVSRIEKRMLLEKMRDAEIVS